jgi:hypothetical protein
MFLTSALDKTMDLDHPHEREFFGRPAVKRGLGQLASACPRMPHAA